MIDKKTFRLMALASAAPLILPLPAIAQSGAGAPDEIIVEGLRLPTRATETGSSVSVITAEDIELRGYAFTIDALASAPGVTVNQNGAFGGVASVRIRGAGSDQTLVLLDGVAIGDPSAVGGGFNFSTLDTADIERIEVLKGPQSTLWGSDAIGGVVNIITKRPEAGLGGTLFAEGGSFGTFRGGAAVKGGGDIGDFRVSVNGVTTDGISKADENDGNTERDSYDGLTIAGRGGLNLPADFRLETSFLRVEGDAEIDGFPPPNFSLADSADRSESTQYTGSATLITPVIADILENRFTVGYTDIKRTNISSGFNTVNRGDRLLLRYQGNATFNEYARAAFGAEREEATANDEETSIDGYFGVLEIKPVGSLTVTGGVRHDDHSRFGGETTARAAVAYAVSENFILRGSWGEGFKAPTIFQLTSTFGALPPNSDLQPETSEAFDVGVDLAAANDRVHASVTYFNRDTENLITFAPNGRYENIAATEAQGVEAAVDIAITDAITASVDYAYIDATDATTGERQIRVPRHSGDFALSYEGAGPFSGTVVVRYNGDETEGPFGSDVEEWVRVDLAGSYAINDSIDLYARVENLFDEEYQQISGYGTPGLSAYGGVRLSF
ncbi:MAG: TonB-dependent receptor [Pseudomonadota bacterium]